jgi:hypothetical protein
VLTLEYFLSKEMQSVLGKSKALELLINDQFYFSSKGNGHFTNIYIPSFSNINVQVNSKPIRSYNLESKFKVIQRFEKERNFQRQIL